jgi:Uma2 family endonuclease
MEFKDLDLTKQYTYADYLKWTFEEAVELIKGRVFRIAAPLSNHQQTSGNLHVLFKVFLKNKDCRVFHAPFDVRLPKPLSQRKSDKDIETVIQPDICVVCDTSKIDRRGCVGAPDLIVEILSKGTATKDVKDKFELYEESGVQEYWIASVEDETVLVYRLDKTNQYKADHRPYVQGDTIKVGIFEDFYVIVEDIFEGLIDFKK